MSFVKKHLKMMKIVIFYTDISEEKVEDKFCVCEESKKTFIERIPEANTL